MNQVQFIIYVEDQKKSTEFYSKILDLNPSLNVPGMTEFNLNSNTKFGLMPENGIVKILKNKTPHPKDGNGIPRCELYLKVKNAKEKISKAVLLGAIEISPLQDRDWGDKVGYIVDIDGHIIAFAEKYNFNEKYI